MHTAYESTDTAQVLSDEQIIQLYWDRNETAITATDEKYGRYLYTIAYNVLHDRLDCEECLNDTYLGTWNRIPPTRPAAFMVFLSKIMKNIAVDRHRKNTAEKRDPGELTASLDELEDCIPAGESVEDEFTRGEIVRILNDYLRTLKERQLTVFVSRYYYCDTLDSIAEMTGTSVNTVLRDLAAIRKGLAARLEKEGYRYE